MCGVEFHQSNKALSAFNKMMKNGLISTLIQGNIIRITPPLIITKKDILFGLKIFSNSLNY
jgi:4-aminobutyrate aminotransferase-like enzyme